MVLPLATAPMVVAPAPTAPVVEMPGYDPASGMSVGEYNNYYNERFPNGDPGMVIPNPVNPFPNYVDDFSHLKAMPDAAPQPIVGPMGTFNSTPNSMMGDWNNANRAQQYNTDMPYTMDTAMSRAANSVSGYMPAGKPPGVTFTGNSDGRTVMIPTAPAPVVADNGWHQRSGTNAWTQNNASPYWNDHEMSTGSPWKESSMKPTDNIGGK